MQNAKVLGITGGITGGLVMLILTILGIMGIGVPLLKLLATLFPGYTVSFVGCIVGMIYGFVVGFVWNYLYSTILGIVEAG
jgi:cell shape-determining protein MreD